LAGHTVHMKGHSCISGQLATLIVTDDCQLSQLLTSAVTTRVINTQKTITSKEV